MRLVQSIIISKQTNIILSYNMYLIKEYILIDINVILPDLMKELRTSNKLIDTFHTQDNRKTIQRNFQPENIVPSEMSMDL